MVPDDGCHFPSVEVVNISRHAPFADTKSWSHHTRDISKWLAVPISAHVTEDAGTGDSCCLLPLGTIGVNDHCGHK